MSLKLYQRGDIWWLRGSVRGIFIRESTKTRDHAAAEEIRIKRESEILSRSIHGAAATASFSEAVLMYLEAGGENRFVSPLLDHFRNVPLARINQTAIDRSARVLYPNAAPATINRQVYTPISAILNFAAEHDLCGFRKIKRPKQPKGRVRWLTFEESKRLIDKCAYHLGPLVIFMLYTGARASEAIYLPWRNVDLSRRQVWFEETKNGEARGVPLHSRVVTELAKLNRCDGNVFLTNRGEPYKVKENSGGQIKTAFNGAVRRAGLKDFHPHDCRHTWATWHYAANGDLLALKELGGWKSLAMVERYAHVNTERLAPTIDKLPTGTKLAQSV